jgi:hypothetical protein
MARAGFAVLSIDDFKQVLNARLSALRERRGQLEGPTVMPIALCLAIPERFGGNKDAVEMISRFGLINVLSGTAIDFYYFGWSVMSADGSEMNFDLLAFKNCWEWIFNAGVKRFGGNADLIIVDAALSSKETVSLNFSEAIRIDLALAIRRSRIDTLGDFLDSLMKAAINLSRSEHLEQRPVFRISDMLALTSLWEIVFKKALDHLGVAAVETVVTRDVGPIIEL